MRLVDSGRVPSFLSRTILLGLQVGPQFPAQLLVVAEPDQDMASLRAAFEDALAVVVHS